MHQPAARAALLHMLPAHLGARGLDAEAVFRAGGLTVEAAETGAIVPRAQICAVLDRAAKALADPHLGLALGMAARPESLGSTGAALLAGGTVGERLRRHAAGMPAMQTHVRLDVTEEGGEAVWRHVLLDDHPDRTWLLYEGASAFTLAALRALLGQDFAPRLVRFPHAPRSDMGAHARVFGAPVAFGWEGGAEIRFDAGLLQRRVRQARAVAEPDMAGPVVSFRLEHDAIHRALALVVEARLAHDDVTLPRCAAVLGLSPRTVQRRLAQSGTTFEAVVDRIRRARALTALSAGEGSVTALAMSLGYADTARFVRAFRRWTGTTPTSFRAARGVSGSRGPDLPEPGGAPHLHGTHGGAP